MKINKIFWILNTLLIFVLFSFQEPKLKKRITDKEFRYEFYTSNDDPEIKSERVYYWFKGGAIHNSEYGISGELLDETFEKFYLSNQLAEKGGFKNGLKIGIWKNWYPNGSIKTIQYWNEGRKKGMSYYYNDASVLIEKGRYSADKKQGKWINYISKDTIKYKEGEMVPPKVKDKNAHGFFERLVTKIDRSKDEVKEQKTPSAKTKKSTTQKPKSENKKKGFFQRLFSKKEKPDGKSS